MIALLDRLEDASVCTVGDIMLDQWIYGRAERISPEAPVPVFIRDTYETRPGGAGNVAANLVALGVANFLVGDWRDKPLKQRFVVGRQQIFRCDIEEVRPLTPSEEDRAFKEATLGHGRPSTVRCLILSDYGKGMLTPNLCQRLISWAREHDVPVVVDPKGKDWRKYRGATVITPNEGEMQAADAPFWPSRHILETRGHKGMMLILNGNEDAIEIPARRREVFDVTGAGDTVVAVLGACLSVGITLEDAARIANAAAGVVVSKPGTAVCTLNELKEELAL